MESIGNWFEHIKIFPKFIELGFDKSEFLFDNDLVKLRENYAKTILKKYDVFGLVNPFYVDSFIGYFFVAKSDISSDHNYSTQYEILKNTDSLLFYALEKTWEEWEKVDIYSNTNINNYHNVSNLLVEELDTWIEDKKVMNLWLWSKFCK